MKWFHLLLLTGLIVSMSGCARIKVASHADPGYDFNAVSTYQWTDASEEILQAEGTYLNEHMQTALNNELASHGWKEVTESDGPDVQVTYYITLVGHVEYAGPEDDSEQINSGFSYSRNSGKWSYAEQQSDLTAYTIEIGTLHVLLLDPASGRQVWQGTLETRIDRSLPVEKQKEFFAQIARKLMVRLP